MTRLAAAAFAALLAIAVSADTGNAQRVPLPVVKIEKGEACVAPSRRCGATT
jgi:hypothetical protein